MSDAPTISSQPTEAAAGGPPRDGAPADPETLEPPRDRRTWARRPEVQGLRAIAILAVVAFHAGLPVPGGFVGVDVFFVISGWALVGVLSAELSHSGTIRVGDFLARRARRLLPLLALVVGVVLVAHVATSNPYAGNEVVPRTGLAALTFVANLYLYRHTGYFDVEADSMNPLLHTWSLSAEEQLYLALPLVLLLGWRIRRRVAAGPAWALAVLAVGSALLAGVLGAGRLEDLVDAPRRLAFYAPFTRAWEVAAGALVALWAPPRVAPRNGAVAVIGVVAGTALVAGAIVATDPFTGFPFPNAVPAVAGTALLLACAPLVVGASRALAARPLRWIGDRSYGWYLWHWPAIVIAVRLVPGQRVVPVLAVVAALGLAAVTYRAVEERFRHDRRLVGTRALAFTVAVLCVPVSFAALAGTGVRHGWGLYEPTDWYDTSLASRSGCLIVNRDLPNTWDEDTCTEHVAESRGTILVLGDSAVSSVQPAVARVARERHLDTASWSRDGCPFTGRPTARYPRCDEWQDDAWELIDRIQPRLVVVANRSLEYVDSGDNGPAPLDPGQGLEGEGTRLHRWTAGLDEMAHQFDDRSLPFVIVGPVPEYGSDFPRARLWPLRRHPSVPILDRSDVDQERAPAVRAEKRAVAASEAAAYVDPAPLLCDDVCDPQRIGRYRYADGGHLNRRGARLLVPEMRAAIHDALQDGR